MGNGQFAKICAAPLNVMPQVQPVACHQPVAYQPVAFSQPAMAPPAGYAGAGYGIPPPMMMGTCGRKQNLLQKAAELRQKAMQAQANGKMKRYHNLMVRAAENEQKANRL